MIKMYEREKCHHILMTFFCLGDGEDNSIT